MDGTSTGTAALRRDGRFGAIRAVLMADRRACGADEVELFVFGGDAGMVDRTGDSGIDADRAGFSADAVPVAALVS